VRSHDIDVTSLVFGLVFVGVSTIWLLVHLEVLTLAVLPIVVPLVLVAVGAIGVAAAVQRTRRDLAGAHRHDPTGP
jgi:uncharacterized membrane protein